MSNELAALSDALADAVKAAAPSVVAVHARMRLGSSGVLWAPGIVVTAEHTIAREEDITVILSDGQELPAELVGRDAGTDLAVLRFTANSSPQLLKAASSPPKVGSLVLALGRATDGATAASLGIVSVSSGEWTTWRGGKLDATIRLDIRLYPTGSGSAVIAPDGSLIGIATSGLTRTLPAAIPAVTADRVVREILETGHVRRGYLGVGLQPVRIPDHLVSAQGLKTGRGLIVLSAEAGGPAEKSGILVGDILLALDGQPVDDLGHLQSRLTGIAPGASAKADLLRGGVPVSLNVTLGQRPARG